MYVEELNMQLMDVPVVSKTKDDATITLPVRVQYFVLPDKVREAYYELDDPEDQIKAHVENVILSHIPKKNFGRELSTARPDRHESERQSIRGHVALWLLN